MTAYATVETEFDNLRGSDDIDHAVIRQAIDHLVAQGKPFSANDLRPLLPAVRVCLISRDLIRAQRLGQIRRTGYEPSTLPSTKGAVVAVYAPSG